MSRKPRTVGISREQCVSVGVDFGDNVSTAGRARRTKGPFHIIKDGQTAGFGRIVYDLQPPDFDHALQGNELGQSSFEGWPEIFEYRISLPMTSDVVPQHIA